jgi:hypothetical protein
MKASVYHGFNDPLRWSSSRRRFLSSRLLKGLLGSKVFQLDGHFPDWFGPRGY